MSHNEAQRTAMADRGSSRPSRLGQSGHEQPSGVAAVVLTFNEAANLPRCLAALEWCDDIVVVDSGSTDDTILIAGELGARTFRHTLTPFVISEQRNWALDNCSIAAPWILFVDADEVVTDRLRQEICRSVTNTELDAFRLAPKFLYHGTWMRRSIGYPIWHDRLLRKGRARIVGGVWEHFADGLRVGEIDEPYLHYANSKGFSEWLLRHDRYSSWDADGILSYLATRDAGSFGTRRRVRLRSLAARFWPFRPLARFVIMYLVRGGFLDGRAALPFCFRYAIYEYMTVEKVVEKRRFQRGDPL